MAGNKSRLRLERPLVSFDLETTGLNVQRDRIVEISCVKIYPNGEREVKTRRLNPEQPISAEATEVHGIRDEDVADEPTFEQVGRSLFSFVEDCDLTGFNLSSFDLPILAREFDRLGLGFPAPNTRVVDSRRIFIAKEPRTLQAAFALYCGRELDGAHSAEVDAIAAAEVLLAQIERYPDLPDDLDALDEFCHPNRKEWVDGAGKLQWKDGEVVLTFGKYRGKSLRRLTEEDRGYLEWVAKADFPPDVVQVISDALAGRFRAPPVAA